MRTVAFIGSSTVAGKGQAFDWVGQLEKRPENKEFRFHNFGRGGDLSYLALKRLPKVIKTKPDKTVIMIGGNDVLATVFKSANRLLVRARLLPEAPSAGWFAENLQCMVDDLKSKANTQIALVSLPPFGEAPSSNAPAQMMLNQLVAQYNMIIKDTAKKDSLAYVPFYEEMNGRLVASPGKELSIASPLLICRDATRYFVLRQSEDEIGKKNGWNYHVDGIHLNSLGGAILADLVQNFINR